MSNVAYKEDYETEKDCVYYPADWSPAYKAIQANENSEKQYKKKYEKSKAENKYNACDTMAYKEQKSKKVNFGS